MTDQAGSYDASALEAAARALYDCDGSSIAWEVCRRGWEADARAALDAYFAAAQPAAPDRAAAAELPARDAARCGCADAERTYEQLWDHAWETGQELDRWKTLAEGWHKHHNEALDARDAARAERDQARAELDRQRALIAEVLERCDSYDQTGDVFRPYEIRELLGGDQ